MRNAFAHLVLSLDVPVVKGLSNSLFIRYFQAAVSFWLERYFDREMLYGLYSVFSRLFEKAVIACDDRAIQYTHVLREVYSLPTKPFGKKGCLSCFKLWDLQGS